jgi:hypothetical protein
MDSLHVMVLLVAIFTGITAALGLFGRFPR